MRALAALAPLTLTLAAASAPAARADDPPAPRFAAGTRATDVTICLQPLGPLDARVPTTVARGVEQAYGMTTRILPRRALPRAAWYAPRKRYRADRLLDHLAAEVVPDSGCAIVLGVTAADISVRTEDHPDWGILGLAYLDSQVAVVSTFRTKRRVRLAQSLQRTVKVATHELGHAFGLPHDDSVPHCMMNDAGGTVRTVDGETGVPCAHERAGLEARLGVTLPARDALDWTAILAP